MAKADSLLKKTIMTIAKSFQYLEDLPYKSLGSRFMSPIKGPKQEHHHCENVNSHVKDPNERPTSVIIYLRMKNHEVEWYSIISEFN